MYCHVPGEPKKVRESCNFWRAEPDLSRNVRLSDCLIYSEKGYPVVVADMRLDRLFHCSKSGYIWFRARIIYFFCRNIPLPEKPFANANAVTIWIYPVLNENYFSLLSEYSRSRSCDESELLLESLLMDSDFSSAKIVQHESLQRYNRS
jgi:hypothetical protein